MNGRLKKVLGSHSPLRPQVSSRTSVEGHTSPSSKRIDDVALNELRNLKKTHHEFVKRISHGIKNPMSGIYGLAQEIRSDIQSILNNDTMTAADIKAQLAKVDEKCREIVICSQYQKSILNEALEISDLQAGSRLKPHEEDFSPKKVIEDIVHSVSNKHCQKESFQHCVRQNLAEGSVYGDVHRFRRIMEIITKNALTTTNGTEIGISLEYLPHSRASTLHWFRIILSYSGRPVTNDFSLKNETGPTYTETGSELNLCYELSRMMWAEFDHLHHNGKNQFVVSGKMKCAKKDSELAAGEVALPIPTIRISSSDEEFSDMERSPSSEGSRSPKPASVVRDFKSVLIVEDNLLNFKLLSRQVSSIRPDLKILRACNGKEGVDLSHSADLIFMDIEMPIMNGFKSTEMIRYREKQENRDPVPIVFISGNASRKDHARASVSGGQKYIEKPYEKEDIKNAIKEMETVAIGFSRANRSVSLS